jgi:hypothetical protein
MGREPSLETRGPSVAARRPEFRGDFAKWRSLPRRPERACAPSPARRGRSGVPAASLWDRRCSAAAVRPGRSSLECKLPPKLRRPSSPAESPAALGLAAHEGSHPRLGNLVQPPGAHAGARTLSTHRDRQSDGHELGGAWGYQGTRTSNSSTSPAESRTVRRTVGWPGQETSMSQVPGARLSRGSRPASRGWSA